MACRELLDNTNKLLKHSDKYWLTNETEQEEVYKAHIVLNTNFQETEKVL